MDTLKVILFLKYPSTLSSSLLSLSIAIKEEESRFFFFPLSSLLHSFKYTCNYRFFSDSQISNPWLLDVQSLWSVWFLDRKPFGFRSIITTCFDRWPKVHFFLLSNFLRSYCLRSGPFFWLCSDFWILLINWYRIFDFGMHQRWWWSRFE